MAGWKRALKLGGRDHHIRMNAATATHTTMRKMLGQPYPSANNAPTAAVGPVRGLPERYPWRYPEVFLAPSDFSPRKRFAPSFLMIWRLRPSARPSAGTSCVITEPEPT